MAARYLCSLNKMRTKCFPLSFEVRKTQNAIQVKDALPTFTVNVKITKISSHFASFIVALLPTSSPHFDANTLDNLIAIQQRRWIWLINASVSHYFVALGVFFLLILSQCFYVAIGPFVFLNMKKIYINRN